MEVQLNKHPSEISFSSSFDYRSRMRREKGDYFLSFDPAIATDAAEFARLFQAGVLHLNGRSSKELLRFDPAFGEPESKKLIEEIHEMRSKLPVLESAADEAEANFELIEIALKENADFDGVDALLKEKRAKQSAAEELRLKADTAARFISAREAKLREFVAKQRQMAADKLRVQLEAAAKAFNAGISKVYADFWSVAGPILPEISKLTPTYPGEIYFTAPGMNIAEAGSMKKLLSRPAIRILKNMLAFETEPINKR